MPCEHGGRNGSGVSASQSTPRLASDHQMLGKKHRL